MNWNVWQGMRTVCGSVTGGTKDTRNAGFLCCPQDISRGGNGGNSECEWSSGEGDQARCQVQVCDWNWEIFEVMGEKWKKMD